MTHTHNTAPTQFVEANGIRFAYRRFGKANGVPLAFSQHYIGATDHWDPTVTGGWARDRGVILFQQRGRRQQLRQAPDDVRAAGR
ncbi:hypothetical protein [Paraburkholderia aspalathi]|uniref:Uncharacterized protein n=1 Tax=Paraburkholderia aspalathi TaxID=1324617 RepID=A0A1I7EPS5_9BURK|nr:hypothetical protein [Paraburkholderia aspalathi]SFU25913.1 hypothetical protein SAMN05192563_104348 [Paraburkholderia aspalathi]